MRPGRISAALLVGYQNDQAFYQLNGGLVDLNTYVDDPISVLRFDMAAFRLAGERVRALGLPTVVVQEGGYMVEAIGAALDAFLEGLRA